MQKSGIIDMELTTYDNKDKWIEIADGFKVKCRYFTIEQSLELERLLVKGTKDDDAESQSQYIYKYVAYAVEDWAGLERDGKPVKCTRKDNKLSDESLEIIYNVPGFALAIFQAISGSVSPVRFSDSDKKK